MELRFVPLKRFATAEYAVALLAVAAATGLRLALEPILGANSPYLLFVGAVILSWRTGGRGPALAATALGVLAVWYFFLEPRFSLRMPGAMSMVGLGLFAAVGAAISFLSEAGGLLSTPGAEPRPQLGVGRRARTARVRRLAVMSGAALALGTLTALLWGGFQRSADAQRWVEHTYQVMNTAAAVRSSLDNAIVAQREYLISGDTGYLEAYRSAIEAEGQSEDALRHLTADNPPQRARLEELGRLVRARIELLARVIEVREHQGAAAAGEFIRTSQANAIMRRLEAVLDGMDEEEHGLLRARTVAASRTDSQTRWILGLGSGSLVVLLLLAGTVIERGIRERERAEQVLAQQARLIDLSHDAIIAADGNRTITGWNAGAREMYGWTEAEAAGRRLVELLHTRSAISIGEIDRILAREGRWFGELTHTTAAGAEIVVESRQVLHRDRAGRPAGYLEINRDVTERKRAEDALRTSEERFRALTTATSEAVYSMSADWSEMRRLDGHGFIADTLEPNRDWLQKYIHPLDQDRVLAAIGEAIRTGSVFELEHRVLQADGTLGWTFSRAVPLANANGETVEWFGAASDITARKRAEEALRQSEEKFSQAFATNPAATALARLEDGLILDVNQAWLATMGYRREEVIRVSSPELGLWATPEERRRFVAELEEKGSVHGWEVTQPRKSGEPVTLLLSAAILNIAGERVVLSASVDITARKRAVEAVRESEAQFRTLANAIPQLCWMANADGFIFWYNDRWYEYTGTTPEQMEGWGWQSVHDPQALPAVLDRWKSSIATGEPFDMVFPLRSGDGVFRSFLTRIVPVRDQNGKVVRWFGTNTDISEQRAVEEALRESRARLEAALASMTDAVFISDSQGRFTHFNDAFATFHKFRSQAECAKTFAAYPDILDVFLPDGSPAPVDMWAVPRALRGEMATNAEYVLRRKDTGERWVGSYSFGPIRGHEGRIVGAVVVGRDITESKQAEEEVRRLNAELEQRVRDRTAQLEASNKELEAFAYSVSHDLRAPLRGVDGWSLALLEDYCSQCERVDGKGRRYLERVRSETQRMGRLIDDLLQLSRITRAEMHCDWVDLSEVAESIAARLRENHPRRSLEFAIQPGLRASADARLLDVALTNLLENAVKFTGPRERARIEFQHTGRDGKSAFVIRDNGVGFDMAYAGMLFGAFQRLHSESEFPGTGIGLATVQRVVHRHGGRIWAEAEPDRGAAFYFTLGPEV